MKRKALVVSLVVMYGVFVVGLATALTNPTTAVSGGMMVLKATTVQQSITLDPARWYTIAHDGEDSSGSASTVTIYVSNADDVIASPAEGSSKAKLLSGRVMQIPYRSDTLKFKTASGEATFTLIATHKQAP